MENLEIYKRLATFNKPNLVKDTQAYNYKYADLGQIQEQLDAPLKASKISYLHYTKDNNVITRVFCSDIPESYIESSIEIGNFESETKESYEKSGKTIETREYSNKDPQGIGSAITYYRRYNLLQIFDLEIDDDDGKGGSPKAKVKESQPKLSGDFHKCLKCGKESEADVFEGKFGPCFKCVHCKGYSKPNKVKNNTDGAIDLSDIPF